MGKGTAIEWADHTFNPVWGCVEISPACDHCYAKAWDKRTGGAHWGPHAPLRTFGDKHWNEPLKWNRDAERDGVRRRVFCASMADVFDNRWPEHVRPRLWDLIRATPSLIWMLLTKRPQNIKSMLPSDWGNGWPHVWLGVTTENQEWFDRRVEVLGAIPAALRFISAEPLLEQIDVGNAFDDPPDGSPYGNIGWVVTGGESGPKARPPHPQSFRHLRDQAACSRTPFLFKQWGDWSPEPVNGEELYRNRVAWVARDGACTIDRDLPDGAVQVANSKAMYRVGKKAAGRLLDGREHNEFPQVQPA